VLPIFIGTLTIVWHRACPERLSMSEGVERALLPVLLSSNTGMFKIGTDFHLVILSEAELSLRCEAESKDLCIS